MGGSSLDKQKISWQKRPLSITIDKGSATCCNHIDFIALMRCLIIDAMRLVIFDDQAPVAA